MSTKRIKRLNSLLREIISDVIRKEVKHPRLSPFATITRVDLSSDLRHADVFVSVIGKEEEREETIKALIHSSGYISTRSSKQISIRYFPSLTFVLDKSVDRQQRIDAILQEIEHQNIDRYV